MTFDPIKSIGDWLLELLISWNMSEALAAVLIKLLVAGVVAGLIMVIFIVQTWIERKVAARFQDRIGPNRVGPFGLIQPIADALKMITKEDTTPAAADKFAYNLAPIMSVASVLLIWAVVPFASTWVGVDLNVGVLYIAAVGSFGVLAVLMAGWSSNNKYALLGAFRGVAQLISYEVPLFLALLIPVLLARSMSLNDIVEAQQGGWFVIYAPLAFVIFLIANMAEIGRTPFDLLEAESEIVAGYHVEYSGMKFGLFQAGEFVHAFTAGALISTLFFGGWNPAPADAPILAVLVFFAKAFFFYFVTIWSRLTLPRIRIDHMMSLNWKFLVPVLMVLLMLTPIADYYAADTSYRIPAQLAVNFVVALFAIEMARRAAKRSKVERHKFEGRPVAVAPKNEETAA